VTVAAAVYFQRGRATQYEVYITQAREAAQVAATKSDPAELRQAWQTTLLHLDQAEAYQTTSESKEMRNQAQAVLDEMEESNAWISNPPWSTNWQRRRLSAACSPMEMICICWINRRG